MSHTHLKSNAYKGIGHIPRNLTSTSDASKRLLLDQLPRLLRGYGRTFAGYPEDYSAAVIVVCDLDDRVSEKLSPRTLRCPECLQPQTGDPVLYCHRRRGGVAAGRHACGQSGLSERQDSVLNHYENDAICGTWEVLADAVYRGGLKKLEGEGWQAVGREKSRWSKTIAPHMDVENNASPSFCYFREKVRGLAGAVG